MKTKLLLLIYGFIITFLFTIAGAISAKNLNELLNSFVFLPLTLHFAISLGRHTGIFSSMVTSKDKVTIKEKESLKTPSKLATITKKSLQKSQEEGAVEPEEVINVADHDRRAFIKLIGSAGLSLFMMALFTKKAQAAFFGSVPGPGVVSLKDSTGTKIDPAEKQPTDGYEIAELDDASLPSYYGFLHKTGAWYISRENPSGSYRYTKGTSSFSTNWTNRASLTYDYFDATF